MSFITTDGWNAAVVCIDNMFGEHVLSTGSAFFWRSGEKYFLVSNWHNFSGRNPMSGQPMSPTGALPDHVRFLTLRQRGAPDGDGNFLVDLVPIAVALVDPVGSATWLEHPTFGRKVDVGAIDVTSLVLGTLTLAANSIESDADVDLNAPHDLFIVGFPYGRMIDAPAPLWKRGTIALDPNYDPDGLPKLFVDTATREGMSGSVAVARTIIVGRAYRRKDGSQSAPVLYATLDTVAGVYSGRLYPDLERAQLGIVWKRRTIDEVVKSGRPARTGLVE